MSGADWENTAVCFAGGILRFGPTPRLTVTKTTYNIGGVARDNRQVRWARRTLGRDGRRRPHWRCEKYAHYRPRWNR